MHIVYITNLTWNKNVRGTRTEVASFLGNTYLADTHTASDKKLGGAWEQG